jgi:hypothetical protein
VVLALLGTEEMVGIVYLLLVRRDLLLVTLELSVMT